MADHLSSVENSKFLKQYKRRKCLWDVDDPLYNDQEAREKAYEKLAQSMNMRVLDVKTKIRLLRSTYCSEDGAEIYQPEESNWQWFIETHRHLDHTKAADDNDGNDVNISSIDECSMVALPSEELDEAPGTSSGRRQTEQTSKKKKKKLRKLKRLKKLKKGIWRDKDKDEEVGQEQVSATKKKAKRKKGKKEKREKRTADEILFSMTTDREFEIFGRTISCQLQELPKMMAMRTMRDIRRQLENLRIQAAEHSSEAPQQGSNNTSDDELSENLDSD